MAWVESRSRLTALFLPQLVSAKTGTPCGSLDQLAALLRCAIP